MQLDVLHLRRALVIAATAVALAAPGASADPSTTTAAAPPSETKVEAAKDEVKLARRRSRRRRSRATPKPPQAREPEAAPADTAPITTSRGRPSRVEFDERLIRGQTNKADAIYPFERRSSEMRTLVKKRKHFHREINETLD